MPLSSLLKKLKKPPTSRPRPARAPKPEVKTKRAALTRQNARTDLGEVMAEGSDVVMTESSFAARRASTAASHESSTAAAPHEGARATIPTALDAVTHALSPPSAKVPPRQRLRQLGSKLATERRKGWKEKLAWAELAGKLDGLDDTDAAMLEYMITEGSPENLPPGRSAAERKANLEEILRETRRGGELLRDVLAGTAPSTDPIQHRRDIRALCWALYRQSVAKGQPFVGGMIVLDDGGKVNDYLRRGGLKKDADGKPPADFYYERPSSHFQERRNESLGMDFHDPALALPLQKRTLHFGSLKGSGASFVKFEYYGFDTRRDKALHTAEFVDVVILQNKEVGYRESPSKSTKSKIKRLLAGLKDGRGKSLAKESVEDPEDGKLTLEKSGVYFARRLIEQRLRGPAHDEAIAELDRIVASEGLDNPGLRQGDEVIFGGAEVDRLRAGAGAIRVP